MKFKGYKRKSVVEVFRGEFDVMMPMVDREKLRRDGKPFPRETRYVEIVLDWPALRWGTLYHTNRKRQEEPAHGWNSFVTYPAWWGYTTCRVCGKPMSNLRIAHSLNRLQKDMCSSKCFRKERFDHYKCCDKAKIRMCVCEYSTKCPEHGIRCHGTHD